MLSLGSLKRETPSDCAPQAIKQNILLHFDGDHCVWTNTNTAVLHLVPESLRFRINQRTSGYKIIEEEE